MMPMLRTLFRSLSTSSATGLCLSEERMLREPPDGGRWGPPCRADPTVLSPAVVSEGAVGLGHLVGVLATLHSGTEAVRGVQDLVHQTLGHGVLTTRAGVADEPAQREGGGTTGLDLDRDRKSTRLNSSHVKISYAVFC